ncbi:HAMP domain-containing sensor histidine kinase [Shinella zoogloeoides]
MRGTRSLSGQLMLWITTTITLLWLVAVGFGAFVMHDEFGEVFDSALQETAERLVPLVVDDLKHRDERKAPLRIEATRGPAEEEYLTYQVRDEAGRVLLHSHTAPAEPFGAPLKVGFWEGHKGRIYTAATLDETIFVQVQDSAKERREATREGSLALLLPVLLIVPLTVTAIGFIVRRVLAPVETLRAAIGEKDGGNLAAIEAAGLPQELRPILRSVNLLLARLRAVLAAEREFTSNSAHELRTPIAGALAQTQLLLSELEASPERVRAQQIEASLQKLTKLTEKLLQLARAEAGIGMTENTFDIADVVGVVVTDFQRASTDAGRIRLTSELSAPVLHEGEADAFAIVLRNLIENGLLHGQADEPVDIRLTRAGNVCIRNGAPRMGEEELAAVRKRFARGRTLAAGSGLGLSIAERLLAQMQACLVLTSPIPGRSDGFQAEILFPSRG